MRIARIAGMLTFMTVAVPVLWPTMANSASPVGDGFCAGGGPVSGDMCIGKNDAGAPWADWTGDNVIMRFNDWRYSGFPNDSPNDDGERILNLDFDAQWVYQEPNLGMPRSCFQMFYNSSDLLGREENDSSLQPRFGIPTCP